MSYSTNYTNDCNDIDSLDSWSIKIFNQNPNQNALDCLALGSRFRGIASLEILTKILRRIRNYYSVDSSLGLLGTRVSAYGTAPLELSGTRASAYGTAPWARYTEKVPP